MSITHSTLSNVRQLLCQANLKFMLSRSGISSCVCIEIRDLQLKNNQPNQSISPQTWRWSMLFALNYWKPAQSSYVCICRKITLCDSSLTSLHSLYSAVVSHLYFYCFSSLIESANRHTHWYLGSREKLTDSSCWLLTKTGGTKNSSRSVICTRSSLVAN